MENWTVKAVDSEEQKSAAEVEEQLLNKAREEENIADQPETEDVAKVNLQQDTKETKEEVVEETTNEEATTESEVTEKPSLTEEEVLSYIGSRYGEEISSIDDLISKRESKQDIPQEMVDYLEYKKETGRGLDDFMRLNKDLDKMDEDQILFEYYKVQKPHLDEDDIDFELSEKFSYEEDDEESSIRKAKIAKKEELAQAKKYFNEQKEKYRTKVESTGNGIPEEELESFNAYKKQIEESQDTLKRQREQSEFFAKKTNELFQKNFEGFEFNIGEKSFKYKPTEASKIQESQSDLGNFVKLHIDERGFLKDAASYHKSLSAAMNPDAFAKFFYEQGKADAVDSITKESKNVNMSGLRSKPQTNSVNSNGLKIVSVGDSSSGSSLRIKSNKNK